MWRVNNWGMFIDPNSGSRFPNEITSLLQVIAELIKLNQKE
jgi:hypothetical protein